MFGHNLWPWSDQCRLLVQQSEMSSESSRVHQTCLWCGGQTCFAAKGSLSKENMYAILFVCGSFCVILCRHCWLSILHSGIIGRDIRLFKKHFYSYISVIPGVTGQQCSYTNTGVWTACSGIVIHHSLPVLYVLLRAKQHLASANLKTLACEADKSMYSRPSAVLLWWE